ncbi:gamma-glutamyl phosphate reductase [Cantharellus anzutake]|uniref:gamma-glutamyl phosphate reductase n=1 Tax=Cantharellus anzutake TaxID=1750568 RepID=UPI001907845F|nr:gamma-glutamyl phosphate reductase [Cantharellus anzutake]KAF8329540.1 gamma-glutamyl phosphate reductase [Cantharellus anzutake]
MARSPEEIAKTSKRVFETSQLVSHQERVEALLSIKAKLAENKDSILQANALDLEAASAEVMKGNLSAPLVKRLDLGKANKWDSMLQGISDVAELPDPNGIISYASELDEELQLRRVSCPIGTILVIFESRPEVVVNIAALAIKSGNAAILKGGKESARTSAEISRVIRIALSSSSLPEDYIQTVQTRDEITSLLHQEKYIDLVIPRGSNALVSTIQRQSRIPVMGHADGLCTVFLDESADVKKAVRVVTDSKIDYPSACNASEILLLHQSLPPDTWIRVAHSLLSNNVELRCDPPSLSLLRASPEVQSLTNFSTHVKPAIEEIDYDTEFLDTIIAVHTVASLSDAVNFINSHSSHHTDSIVTESSHNAEIFCKVIDSAGVYVNASTRFADGFRYGFGTEVGISTGRIHARGPVGLEGLVIYKYVLVSKAEGGHVAAEFGLASGKKRFNHTSLPLNEGLKF